MEKNGEATNMLTLPLILYSFVTVAFSADYALRRRVPVARTRRFFCFFATQVLTMFCNLVSLASENLFFRGGVHMFDISLNLLFSQPTCFARMHCSSMRRSC